MFSAVCYQNELFCHFCHDWCLHPMRLMSSCVFIYAMSSLQRCLPCIFVINVVTSTSMQTRHRDVADFSPCSAVILMPESSLQECFMMLICWICYNMLFCHFCHDWSVHPMRLMSTCVLIYAMPSFQRCYPCIFVINVVTSTSMQTRHRDVADFDAM